MLKSIVMVCQKKLSDDHTPSISNTDNTVAYMLVWLLCIAFLRDTDHGSEVSAIILCLLYIVNYALSILLLPFKKTCIVGFPNFSNSLCNG